MEISLLKIEQPNFSSGKQFYVFNMLYGTIQY